MTDLSEEQPPIVTDGVYTPTPTVVPESAGDFEDTHEESTGPLFTFVDAAQSTEDPDPPPLVISYPSLSTYAPTVGVAFTITHGVYEGAASVTNQLVYADTGVAIATNVGTSHTPTSSDQGRPLTYCETAVNASGVTVTTSTPITAPVSITPPTIQSEPTLSTLSPVVGVPIVATPGVYPGAVSVIHQWLYVDTQEVIEAATGLTYTPVTADLTRRIEYQDIATNVGGEVIGSVTTAAVVAASIPAPTIASAPTLSTNAPTVGIPVLATPTVYNGSSLTVTYTWTYQDTGVVLASGTVSGASISYDPVVGDEGHKLKYADVAVNSAGSASDSVFTAAAVVAAPVNSGVVTADNGTITADTTSITSDS